VRHATACGTPRHYQDTRQADAEPYAWERDRVTRAASTRVGKDARSLRTRTGSNCCDQANSTKCRSPLKLTSTDLQWHTPAGLSVKRAHRADNERSTHVKVPGRWARHSRTISLEDDMRHLVSKKVCPASTLCRGEIKALSRAESREPSRGGWAEARRDAWQRPGAAWRRANSPRAAGV
jgi:hypothetical protein